MQGGDQVSAVVYDHVRPHFQHPADIFKILLFGTAVDGEDIKAFVHQRCGHVVLGAQRVGAGDVHFCPAGGQYLAQMRRLGFQVHAEGHLQTLERLGLFKVLLNTVQ